MAEPLPGKERFQQAYEGTPPWDIGKPQTVFVGAADRITGSILDAGCGTGENALFFSERGHQVTGIDFLETPIEVAKSKAQARGVSANFFVSDALQLQTLPQVFDSIIDCGLFHVFSDEDRTRYVASLASALRSGGRLHLLCFSDQEPPGDGPRRVSQQEIQTTFGEDWEIESIQPARFDVRPDLEDVKFSEGGALAWFCTIRRA